VSGKKIIEGLKEAASHAASDTMIMVHMKAIQKIAAEEKATWCDVRVKIWHGKTGHELGSRTGPKPR
jgi:hypothetical protein